MGSLLVLDIDGTCLVSCDPGITHAKSAEATAFYASQGIPDDVTRINQSYPNARPFLGPAIPKYEVLSRKTKGGLITKFGANPARNDYFIPLRHALFRQFFQRIYSGDLSGKIDILVMTNGLYIPDNLGYSLDILYGTYAKKLGDQKTGLFQHQAMFASKNTVNNLEKLVDPITKRPITYGRNIDSILNILAIPDDDGASRMVTMRPAIKSLFANEILKRMPGVYQKYILIDDSEEHRKDVTAPNLALDPTSEDFQSQLRRSLGLPALPQKSGPDHKPPEPGSSPAKPATPLPPKGATGGFRYF